MERKKLEGILDEIQQYRKKVLEELNDLTEEEFSLSTASRPWKWDTAIRVLLQFGNHMREHANQVQGVRAKNNRLHTHPQRILAESEVARGLLLAALVGITDEDLDAAPPDGGWSIRQTLEHIRNSEVAYLEALLKARQEKSK